MHPGLTLTGMYNVLEKLRGGDLRSPSSSSTHGDRRSPPLLTDKERKIHDEGLVSILKQIHDDLDQAVLEAYGWEDLGSVGVPPASSPFQPSGQDARAPVPFADRLARKDENAGLLEQELLTRLVALNHERAAEEANGLVRWLRPEYQAPEEARSGCVPLPGATGDGWDSRAAKGSPSLPEKLKWPTGLTTQVAEIQKLLPSTGPDAATISACFGKKSKARQAQIAEILETLKSLGKLE